MQRLADLSLLELIPQISPEHKSPWHLADWCGLLERAATEPVRAMCAVPIRHYKTETTLHGIVYLLLKDPTLHVIHLSHSFERAQALGKRVRQLAQAAGVGPERGTNTISDWRNDAGGGVVVMSADQSKLGYDCGCLIFDDPLDEHGSQDPKKREEVDQTIAHYTARCMSKGKPGPVLGVMSRWHPDDPVGRRLARKAVNWEYIHKPAIENEGTEHERAFAEDVWPLEAMKKMRAEWAEKDPTERGWNAQLMGDPRPEGADLFGAPTFYTELPTTPYRIAHGSDFSFTAGIMSDYFAIVSGRIYGRKFYITDVQRHKIDARMIESSCKLAIDKHGRAPIYSYQSGPEKGMSLLLLERGVPIVSIQARYNKLVRAERTVKRWNDGDILVPHSASGLPWVHGFLHRVGMFRGNDRDDGDDEIDALVSLCDGAMGGAVAGPRTLGQPRM